MLLIIIANIASIPTNASNNMLLTNTSIQLQLFEGVFFSQKTELCCYFFSENALHSFMNYTAEFRSTHNS